MHVSGIPAYPAPDMDRDSFDELPDVYDAPMDWPNGLANEQPFCGVRRQLTGIGP